MKRFLTDKHRTLMPQMGAEMGRHGQEVPLERTAAILELIYERSGHSVDRFYREK